MKKPIVFTLILLLSLGCAGLQGPDNVFNIKGKDGKNVTHTLNPTKMNALGKKWRPYIPTIIKTHLKQNDVEYVMNQLTLENSIYSNCNIIKLVSVNDFSGVSDDLHSLTGMFDEVWKLVACKKTLKYRVVNLQNTRSFNVIQVLDE